MKTDDETREAMESGRPVNIFHIGSVGQMYPTATHVTNHFYGDQFAPKDTAQPRNSATAPQPKPKPRAPKKEEKPFRPVTATFSPKQGLPEIRFTYLYQFLQQVEWIDSRSRADDFLDLFSGRMNDCRNIWNTGQGKGKLRDLFRMMIDQGFILCPAGYGYQQIVESHFTDIEGKHITGLRGGAHAEGAGQVLLTCRKILNGEAERFLQQADNVNPDYFGNNGLYPDHLNGADPHSAKSSARRK